MNAVVIVLIFLSFCYCHFGAHAEKKRFELEYQWSLLNFTWPNEKIYKDAIDTKRYIPENTAMAGIKFYKNKFYLAIPRLCDGVPVTMGYFSTDKKTLTHNPLVTPFPDWETNDPSKSSCDKLFENVQSIEIDKDGIMWIIDGVRLNPKSKCPPKLVLYDLNKNSVVQSYEFPKEVCSIIGGFLNDLVIDDDGGGFAYITDHSYIDPGLIVYSRSENRAWKFRDASMMPERNSNFEVKKVPLTTLEPIDGIALSPAGSKRFVYYTPFSSYKLFAISTDILKSETTLAKGDWRNDVKFIGIRSAQGDGMIVDSSGVLYYGLVPSYAVAKWDTNTVFKEKIVDQNYDLMVWTDSFAFDDKGYLYLLADHMEKFAIQKCQYKKKKIEINFRILKYFTGTKSYLF